MKKINKTFKYVWASRFISIIGTGLTEFGVSVWIFAMTGKATPMAITMLCSILPSILFAPFSGILSDRFSRKKIIISADSIAAVASLLLFWYLKTERYHFSLICIFTFSIATANLFDNNAYQASLLNLVDEKELNTANGMNQIIDSSNSILAPLLAGILYYSIGLKGIIILDLSSYILSIALLSRVAPDYFSKANFNIDSKANSDEDISLMSKINASSIFSEINAGFHFIGSQKSLTLLLLFFAVLNFLFNLSGSLIEPLSLSIGNSMQLGFIKMCGGAGMLLGSLFITFKSIKMSYSKGILWSAGVAGASLIIMGIKDSVVTIALGRLLFSFVGPISNTMAGTLWIIRTPKILQGRVYSARIMIVRCIMPVSYLLVGPLADQWIPALLKRCDAANLIRVLGFNSLNYRLVFVVSGMIVILCTLSFCSTKSFRCLDFHNSNN